MARGYSQAGSEKAARLSRERKANLVSEENSLKEADRFTAKAEGVDRVINNVEFQGRSFNVAADVADSEFGENGYFGDNETYGWSAIAADVVRVTENLKDGREVEIKNNSKNSEIFEHLEGNDKVLESLTDKIADNEPPEDAPEPDDGPDDYYDDRY
jgi:hypothetical protein